MTDLRAAVEGLDADPPVIKPTVWRDGQDAMRAAVLDLIPEGSVLVTEAEVYTAANDAMRDAAATGNEPLTWSTGVAVGVEAMLAAILARIREGQR